MSNQIPPPLPPDTPPQLPLDTSQYQPQQRYQQPRYRHNLYQPKQKVPKVIKILIGIGAFFILATIFGVFHSIFLEKNNKSTEKSGIASLNDATIKWREKAVLDSTNIADGYFSASSFFDYEEFTNKFHELQLIAVQHVPNEVTDSTIIRLANQNANKASNLLADSINVYREQYTKVLKDELWLDNIKVKTQNGGKTLWLIGADFASNRNILEFHKASRGMFIALGYKRICYKWADISSIEYTYFDL